MYIKILLNYILGYINIEIEGFFVERIINLCISKKILLWNIKRNKSTIIYCNMEIKDFKRLIRIAKENKCRVRIVRKRGLPFIFYKYKKRKIFFAFLVLLILGIIVLSNFIWNIDIIGNSSIPTEEILNNLEKDGLKKGMLKSKINTKDIVNRIRLERDDLAWIGIEIKGTNAIVKLVEADKKPDIVDENDYCNIVATKPGIITKVDAINGTPLVKEGDVIKEGTILIGGWLEGKYTETRYVHANGQVQAKVWYSQKEKIELKQTIKEFTGRVENKYSLRLNNFLINFYKTLSKFQKYDTIETVKKIRIFSDLYLPMEVQKKTNNEYIEKQVEYSVNEAKTIGEEKAKEILDKQIDKKESIVNIYVNYNKTDSYVETEVIYEVLERIGTEEKIVF